MHIYEPKQNSLSSEQVAKVADCSLEHDTKQEVTGLSSLSDPSKGSLVFVSRRSGLKRSELELLNSSSVSALIAPSGMTLPHSPTFSIFYANDPYRSFLKLVPEFFTRFPEAAGRVHKTAIIGENCTIDESVDIGAYSVIGDNVSIGSGTVIFPHVVIYSGAKIGSRCIIHSGATIREQTSIGDDCYLQNGVVIGSDGFGYIPDPEVGITEVPQVGTTELSARVDVGANSCIDRAAFGRTQVGTATKIDNQVQIGHNVQIGDFSIVCAQVGLAGSAKIGKHVTIGGQTGVADHIHIGDGVRLGAKTGVTGSIEKKGDYLGFPATPAQQWRRQISLLNQLTKNAKAVLSLLKSGRNK